MTWLIFAGIVKVLLMLSLNILFWKFFFKLGMGFAFEHIQFPGGLDHTGSGGWLEMRNSL